MESTRRKINGIRFFFPSRLLSLHCSYMEEIGEILKICNGFIFLFFSFSWKGRKGYNNDRIISFLCCSCENVYKRNRDKIKGVRFSFFFLER